MALLGYSKLESAVRYPGVEVDDAIAISEGVDLLDHGNGQLAPVRPFSTHWREGPFSPGELSRPMVGRCAGFDTD
jgi:hypothetical protein